MIVAWPRGRTGRARQLTEEPRGAINLRLPLELREHFRRVCALRGVAMTVRMEELMEQEVADNRHLLGEDGR